MPLHYSLYLWQVTSSGKISHHFSILASVESASISCTGSIGRYKNVPFFFRKWLMLRTYVAIYALAQCLKCNFTLLVIKLVLISVPTIYLSYCYNLIATHKILESRPWGPQKR